MKFTLEHALILILAVAVIYYVIQHRNLLTDLSSIPDKDHPELKKVKLKHNQNESSPPLSCRNYKVIHYDAEDKDLSNVQVSSIGDYNKINQTQTHLLGKCNLVHDTNDICQDIFGFYYDHDNHHVFKVCTNDPESGFCKASDQQCTDCKGNDDCEKRLIKNMPAGEIARLARNAGYDRLKPIGYRDYRCELVPIGAGGKLGQICKEWNETVENRLNRGWWDYEKK